MRSGCCDTLEQRSKAFSPAVATLGKAAIRMGSNFTHTHTHNTWWLIPVYQCLCHYVRTGSITHSFSPPSWKPLPLPPEVITIIYAVIYTVTTGPTALPTMPSSESVQPPLAARASVSAEWENVHVASIWTISILWNSLHPLQKVQTAAQVVYLIG